MPDQELSEANVYISYSRSADRDFASRLGDYLVRNRITTLSQSDLPSNTAIPELVAQAIKDSDAVIVLASESSSDSPWIQEEVSLALSAGVQILPVWLDRSGQRLLSADPDLSMLMHVSAIDWATDPAVLRAALEAIAEALGLAPTEVDHSDQPRPDDPSPKVLEHRVPVLDERSASALLGDVEQLLAQADRTLDSDDPAYSEEDKRQLESGRVVLRGELQSLSADPVIIERATARLARVLQPSSAAEIDVVVVHLEEQGLPPEDARDTAAKLDETIEAFNRLGTPAEADDVDQANETINKALDLAQSVVDKIPGQPEHAPDAEVRVRRERPWLEFFGKVAPNAAGGVLAAAMVWLVSNAGSAPWGAVLQAIRGVITHLFG